MCIKMEYKVIVCGVFLIAFVAATKVELSSKWQTDVGWAVNCSWILYSNDSLQSVRLSENEHQFLIYRPQKDGPQYSETFRRLPQDRMFVDCKQTDPRGVTGTCVLTIEFYQPPTKDLWFDCEVSGERPRFRVDRKDIQIRALVPPTDAIIELQSTITDEDRVTVNCTSSGLPDPHLSWTIGDQKIPQDFRYSSWNETSKLWNVWSTLTYTHSSDHKATCTPQIILKNETVTGVSATYNSADNVKDIRTTFFTIVASLLLLR